MAKKILVVDNDPEFVEALVSVLDANGYETVSATEGKTGVEKATALQPDLVLLDIMMQNVSEGLDVALLLRDNPATKDIPIIFITGIRKPDFLMDSYRPGEEWPAIKGTLEKPIKPDDLIKKVRGIIG